MIGSPNTHDDFMMGEGGMGDLCVALGSEEGLICSTY